MVYLSAATARTKLTNLGKYPDFTEAALADLLLTLEDIVDAWLGWRAALTLYQETTQADRAGRVTLTHSPVERIDTVTSTEPSGQFFNTAIVQTWQAVNYFWIPQDNRLKVFPPHVPVQVTYMAGYNPLPRIFATTMFQLLRAVLEASGLSGDLSFLDEPVKDVASINLPGGLAKTFFKGGQSGGSEAKGTMAETRLDRLLAPLKQYRRHYVLTTGICKRLDDSVSSSDLNGGISNLPELDGGTY